MDMLARQSIFKAEKSLSGRLPPQYLTLGQHPSGTQIFKVITGCSGPTPFHYSRVIHVPAHAGSGSKEVTHSESLSLNDDSMIVAQAKHDCPAWTWGGETGPVRDLASILPLKPPPCKQTECT